MFSAYCTLVSYLHEVFFHVSAVLKWVRKYEMRSSNKWRRWCDLVFIIVFPINEVVILSILPLNSCDYVFDLIYEYWTSSFLCFQFFNQEVPFFMSFQCLMLDVFEESAIFILFFVRTQVFKKLLVFLNFVVIIRVGWSRRTFMLFLIFYLLRRFFILSKLDVFVKLHTLVA